MLTSPPQRPTATTQTSKALLNLMLSMLSPVSLVHRLPQLLLMPLLKVNPSEDVRYLLITCDPTCSKMVLPHKAISCPFLLPTTFYAPCAALTRPRFCSKLELPSIELRSSPLMILPLALKLPPKVMHPALLQTSLQMLAIISTVVVVLNACNPAILQRALLLLHRLIMQPLLQLHRQPLHMR